MNTDVLTPPGDLLASLKSLKDMILEDVSGEMTRRCMAYFDQAQQLSLEMQVRTADLDERAFAGTLADAHGAASRIVQEAWRKAHGRDI